MVRSGSTQSHRHEFVRDHCVPVQSKLVDFAALSFGDPDQVAVGTIGAYVYVANYFSNTVSVINALTRSVATVNVGANPSGVAVSPDGAHVYVTNSGAATGVLPQARRSGRHG